MKKRLFSWLLLYRLTHAHIHVDRHVSVHKHVYTHVYIHISIRTHRNSRDCSGYLLEMHLLSSVMSWDRGVVKAQWNVSAKCFPSIVPCKSFPRLSLSPCDRAILLGKWAPQTTGMALTASLGIYAHPWQYIKKLGLTSKTGNINPGLYTFFFSRMVWGVGNVWHDV